MITHFFSIIEYYFTQRNLANQEQLSMLRSRFTNAICCLKILFSFEPCSDEGSFIIRFKNKFILDAVKSRYFQCDKDMAAIHKVVVSYYTTVLCTEQSFTDEFHTALLNLPLHIDASDEKERLKILLNNEKFITIKCLSGYVHSLINDFSLLSDEHTVKESVVAHLRGTVNQNVINDQVISIQTLVFSIALGIPQHIEESLAGLGWPSTLGSFECLALGMSADTTVEPSERNDLLLSHNILQILLGSGQRHVLDGLGCFPGVLLGMSADTT